jgi:cobalamin biosynthesis protein CobC
VEAADHGGGIDAAALAYGGARADWIDLSTGINPVPYPLGAVSTDAWAALPDAGAFARLEAAARCFWSVPSGAAVLAAPGASALIARIPALLPPATVSIPGPTYNEHGRAFIAAGWTQTGETAQAQVIVHPNNPDGRLWDDVPNHALHVIDESFCDVTPEASLIRLATRPGTLILKSFGKFWGLAGLRLGFAVGDPALIARLAQMIGPWAVSGPALEIGTRALTDDAWAETTRQRLAQDAARLDALIGAPLVGGTTLFRLYDVGDAAAFQKHLAQAQIWTRVFPYSSRWVRLGLPGSEPDWQRLRAALATVPA